jgi:hypothetical protein
MQLGWSLYFEPLAGGALIGASAALFLLFDGRIAGVSGIVGGLLGSRTAMTATNAAFVLGLLLGSWLFRLLTGGFCPGPAIASFGLLRAGSLLFVPAMVIGMALYRVVPSRPHRMPA